MRNVRPAVVGGGQRGASERGARSQSARTSDAFCMQVANWVRQPANAREIVIIYINGNQQWDEGHAGLVLQPLLDALGDVLFTAELKHRLFPVRTAGGCAVCVRAADMTTARRAGPRRGSSWRWGVACCCLVRTATARITAPPSSTTRWPTSTPQPTSTSSVHTRTVNTRRRQVRRTGPPPASPRSRLPGRRAVVGCGLWRGEHRLWSVL